MCWRIRSTPPSPILKNRFVFGITYRLYRVEANNLNKIYVDSSDNGLNVTYHGQTVDISNEHVKTNVNGSHYIDNSNNTLNFKNTNGIPIYVKGYKSVRLTLLDSSSNQYSSSLDTPLSLNTSGYQKNQG